MHRFAQSGEFTENLGNEFIDAQSMEIGGVQAHLGCGAWDEDSLIDAILNVADFCAPIDNQFGVVLTLPVLQIVD